MTALAADRKDTKISEPGIRGYPVVASDIIYKGGLVALDTDGYLNPAANTTGWKVKGVAVRLADNSAGASGDVTVQVRSGISVNVLIASAAQTNVGDIVYVTDDTTVTFTAGNNVIAGYVEEIISSTEVRIWIPLGGCA